MIGSINLKAWFPDWASTFAPDVDVPFLEIYVTGVCLLVVTVGLSLVFLRTFQRKAGDPEQMPSRSNNKFVLAGWVLMAVGLAGFAFVAGLRGVVDQAVPPYGALQVNVTAREGVWDFAYPQGHVVDTLRVPVDVPVQLNLTTEDISQQLSIPSMRVQQAILPGRTTTAWFQAIAPGTFPLYTGAFSVPTQDSLRTAVISLNQADYAAWLAAVGDIFAGRTLVEVGEFLYTREGCKACHSLDGTTVVGPSFKNVYGFEFLTTTGETVLADDAYIKESILDPNASIIDGYQPVMTPYAGKLGDKEIEAIIEFLKTLSERGGAAEGQEGN